MLKQIVFLCLALGVANARQVVLNTSDDFTGSLWTVDCRYATNVDDFWIIDCDLAGAADSGKGYWTPCDSSRCTITYNKNEAPSPDGLAPESVTIRRRVAGGAVITVTTGGQKVEFPGGTTWAEVSHDFLGSTNSRSSVTIELSAASTTNYSVIDLVEINFGLGQDPPTTPSTPTTTEGSCPPPRDECPPCNCNCNCGCPAKSAFL